MKELRHYAHCVGQNTYHLQWTTKYRDDRFRTTYRRKLCEGAIKIAAFNHGIRIIALRVLKEHVHMFAELKPSMSPSKAMQLIKGISSRIIRRRVPHLAAEKALWSPGKFIRSVGNVTAETIEHYITQSAKNQPDRQTALITM
jgi:putative transposase